MIIAHTALLPPLPVIFIVLWLIHLMPLLVVALPVWFFSRKRVGWNGWDFAIIICPFTVWFLALMTIKGSVEAGCQILGFIAPLAPILRVVLAGKLNQKALAFGLLVVLCCIAVGLAAFLPELCSCLLI